MYLKKEKPIHQFQRLLGHARLYVFATILVATATILTLKSRLMVGDISSCFFLAVMVSTWFWGMGPGLWATALAGWASAYFFFDIPKGSGLYGWDDALRQSIFLTIALVISFLVNMRKRAERMLRNANETLESRVQERTQELEASNRMTRESEEGFRALVQGVTDCAICLLDPHGQVVRWNSGAERIQGYPEAQILHRHYEIFFLPHDREVSKPKEDLAKAAKSGRYEDEGWRIRRDGSSFWATVIITSLHDDQGLLRGFAHVARDITQLKRLEREVIEVAEKEQRRIGHDLHDGLGQELTGLAFLSQNIGRKLAERSLPEAVEIARISSLINSAIGKTRDVAKGLSPVEWGPDGLIAALRNLSIMVRESFGIPVEFRREGPAQIASHTAAVHLYRIAQEAIGNAARHSRATRIWLSFDDKADEIVLSIEDNGVGIAAEDPNQKGMGLRLMPYRARMIAASFDLQPREGGGTLIRCVYPKSADLASEPDAIALAEPLAKI